MNETIKVVVGVLLSVAGLGGILWGNLVSRPRINHIVTYVLAGCLVLGLFLSGLEQEFMRYLGHLREYILALISGIR